VHEIEETVRRSTSVERLASLPPAFRNDEASVRFPEIGWRITVGNSSQLAEGAASVLLMSERRATSLGLTPRARVVAMNRPSVCS
jgi:acetyl-CoA acetyltransferase